MKERSMKKVLIAYGTKTGSTKEVAEEIGKVLGSCGIRAEVSPFSAAQDLEGYSGYILGAPVNGMRWLPEALAFVNANQAAMRGKPVAYFLLSVVMSGGRPGLRKMIPNCLDPARAVLEPVSVGTFGGRMQSDPPFILRLMFGIKKDCPRDGRNWEEIRAWAKGMAARF
jgi:menaquinone-dependent protoporphyrinogen oxidase